MMMNLGKFSVYNNLLSNRQSQENPLIDLVPEDFDHGWHVARNLIKPLNHLDFLKQKEKIAVELNLHNRRTPVSLFDMNYQILEKHQERKISTLSVIDHLSAQLQAGGQMLSKNEIVGKLRDYATVRHMEFHPCDSCNLTCCECTYGHDEPKRKPAPISFPFQEIKKIAQLKPRSMVIIGGGEPTLYRDKNHSFQAMIHEIIDTNSEISLALITNGTHKPTGDWPNQLDWIRLSLDAATETTYTSFRGKPMFSRVLQNFLFYLDYNVRYVGISFLFARSNISDYAEIAKLIFDLVKREKPKEMDKVNIQYRPLRRDPCASCNSFTQAVSANQVYKTVKEVKALAETSTEMRLFLKDQTNITAILGGNSYPPHDFKRCYYSQLFRIVRANGDLRPCFVRVSEPDFILGNIMTDSLETIALNTLSVAALQKQYCDNVGCRQCHVNYTFEKGLEGKINPSRSSQVLADPMF